MPQGDGDYVANGRWAIGVPPNQSSMTPERVVGVTKDRQRFYGTVRLSATLGVTPAILAVVRFVTRRRNAYAGVIAITRRGLPLPFTILSGAAITIAPVAGS